MISPAYTPDLDQAAVQQMIDEALGQAMDQLNVTYTPTEGQTISLPATDQDLFVNLTPATDLNQLTIQLPPESSSRDNQRLVMRSSRNITEITVIGATTVDNAIVMLNAGSVTVFFKFAPNLWSRTV
ncbi:hypothetical protein H4C81_14130 [Pseudomonas monteilii]|uniref:hypothetical protein n=1 Tax=Pseudomonas monteilii TaxID=76759 RepID=UPI0015FD9019|nr:hypothetical protein [Pseudomonas monteilii]MBA6090022.1 hypothetical protein [Pseudomonas monteilii]